MRFLTVLKANKAFAILYTIFIICLVGFIAYYVSKPTPSDKYQIDYDQYTSYYNDKWHYIFYYPNGWVIWDTSDDHAMIFSPLEEPIGYISMSVDDNIEKSLKDYYSDYIDNLEKNFPDFKLESNNIAVETGTHMWDCCIAYTYKGSSDVMYAEDYFQYVWYAGPANDRLYRFTVAAETAFFKQCNFDTIVANVLFGP